MKSMSRWSVVAISAVALMVGFVVGSPNGAGAQAPGSVSVQAYICPEDYAGPDWVQNCELLPDVEVYAYLDASEYGFTEVTDSNGEVYFPDLGIGEFVIELGVPGDFAGFHSYCGAVEEPGLRPIEGADTNRIILQVGEGEELYCTFFVSPVDARGEEPVDSAGTDDVEALPTTGAGSIMNGESGLATVFLLIGGVVLLAGLGMFTAREDLFER